MTPENPIIFRTRSMMARYLFMPRNLCNPGVVMMEVQRENCWNLVCNDVINLKYAANTLILISFSFLGLSWVAFSAVL